MRIFIAATLLFLTSLTAQAESWYEKKVDNVLLYDLFVKAGVPAPAVQRTFEFLDINQDKEFEVKVNDEMVPKTIANKDYAVIVDYSQPSTERRLFLLNLKTGTVDKYFVAHGVKSGITQATSFSNRDNSRQTSLGLYLTGNSYQGSHGESLYLHGLEASNNNAFNRDIVMHGAKYISLDFLEKYGRMGRSWGCPAVSMAIIKKIVPRIQGGAVFFAYHKDLAIKEALSIKEDKEQPSVPVAQTSTAVQEVGKDQQAATKDSDNVVPEEINP
jgi:hypothetical protein